MKYFIYKITDHLENTGMIWRFHVGNGEIWHFYVGNGEIWRFHVGNGEIWHFNVRRRIKNALS